MDRGGKGPRNDADATRRETVTTTVTGLKGAGSHLYDVLAEYERMKDSEERGGLCHNIAIAIMRDLGDRGIAADWTWCRGNVDGGLDHSWVEYRGISVDKGDDHRLRVRTMARNPPFTVEGDVFRRDAAETIAWAKERNDEEQRALKDLWNRLRTQILAAPTTPPVEFAAILVKPTASPFPFPEPREDRFTPPPLARFGLTDGAVTGVAHGFERLLDPQERTAVAALFPDHSIDWSHTTWQDAVLADN